MKKSILFFLAGIVFGWLTINTLSAFGEKNAQSDINTQYILNRMRSIQGVLHKIDTKLNKIEENTRKGD